MKVLNLNFCLLRNSRRTLQIRSKSRWPPVLWPANVRQVKGWICLGQSRTFRKWQ